MLRKIWNTLRHGDGRTKSFLLWEIGLILATVIFVCVAIGTHSFLPWVFAAATAILAAAMAKDAVLVVKNGGHAGKQTGSLNERGDEIKDFGDEDTEKSGRKKKSKKEKKKEEQEAKEQEEREREDEEEFGDNALASMTAEKLKKLLIRYKVKQEHVPVVIDLCVPERVRQAPGFAWVEDGSLKILLIDRKARMLERPLSKLQVMEVERGIAVKASNEYVELRENEVMKKAFTPYLPRYQKKEIGGRTVLLKNLYILDEDIKFTSTSVNELKKLFSFRIEIADRRLSDMDLSPHYKKVFTDSFLWRDGILTLQEFKAQVEQVIESLADPAVPYGEFELTVSAMINSGLLPPEYRNFANARREEKEKGVVTKKGKKKGRK
ncbi:MAG: hypothetical protein IJ427_13210 [Lachnospiraceae bacterium]|nr:hypothetical protein [Lachnospiraceae bacterium]MBQ8847296.1 hypothetical protein [Lachnospiraceae bacterium]